MSSLGGGQLPLAGFFTKNARTATKKRPRKADPVSTTRTRSSGTAHASTSKQGQLQVATGSSQGQLDGRQNENVDSRKVLKVREAPHTRTKVKAASVLNPSSRPRKSTNQSAVVGIRSSSPPPAANQGDTIVMSDELSSSLTPLSLSPTTSPRPSKKSRIGSSTGGPKHLPTPSQSLPSKPGTTLRSVLRFRTPPPNAFSDRPSQEPASPSPTRRRKLPGRTVVSQLDETPPQVVRSPATLRSSRTYHQAPLRAEQEDSGDEPLIPTSPVGRPAPRRLYKRPRPDLVDGVTPVSTPRDASPLVGNTLTLSPSTATPDIPDRIPSSQAYESPLKQPLRLRTSPGKKSVHADTIVPSSQYFEQSLHIPAIHDPQSGQVDHEVVPTSHPSLEACLPGPPTRDPLSRAGSSPAVQPPEADLSISLPPPSQITSYTPTSPVKSSQTQYLSPTRRRQHSPLHSFPNSPVASSQSQNLSPLPRDADSISVPNLTAPPLSPTGKGNYASFQHSAPVSPVRSSQSPTELFIALPSLQLGSQTPRATQSVPSGSRECDASSTPVRGLSFATRSSSPLPAAFGFPSSSPYNTPQRRALKLKLDEEDISDSPSAVLEFGTVFEEDEEFSEVIRTSQALVTTVSPFRPHAPLSQDSGSDTEDESDEEHTRSVHTTPRAARVASPTRISQRTSQRRPEGTYDKSPRKKGNATHVISPTRRVRISPVKSYAAYTSDSDDSQQSLLGTNTQSVIPGTSFPQFSSLPFSLPMFPDVDHEQSEFGDT